MRVRTVTLARLATGRLRFCDRRPLRERRRLSFATPSLFFQRRSQLGDLLTQGLQFLPQLGTLTTIVSRLLRVHDRGDYQPSPEWRKFKSVINYDQFTGGNWSLAIFSTRKSP